MLTHVDPKDARNMIFEIYECGHSEKWQPWQSVVLLGQQGCKGRRRARGAGGLGEREC